MKSSFTLLLVSNLLHVLVSLTIRHKCKHDNDCGLGFYCDKNTTVHYCICHEGHIEIAGPSSGAQLHAGLQGNITRKAQRHARKLILLCVSEDNIEALCMSDQQCELLSTSDRDTACKEGRCVYKYGHQTQTNDTFIKMKSKSYFPTLSDPDPNGGRYSNYTRFIPSPRTKGSSSHNGGFGVALKSMAIAVFTLLGCGVVLGVIALIRLARSKPQRSRNDSVFRSSASEHLPRRHGGRRPDSRPPSYGSVPPPSYEESAALCDQSPVLSTISEFPSSSTLPTTSTASSSTLPNEGEHSKPTAPDQDLKS